MDIKQAKSNDVGTSRLLGTNRPRLWWPVMALFVCLALLASACGDGDDEAGPAPSDDVNGETPDEAGEEPDDDVVDSEPDEMLGVVRVGASREFGGAVLYAMTRDAASYGIEVEMAVEADSYPDLQRALIQGEADVVNLGYNTMIAGLDQGIDNIKILGGLFDGGHQLILAEGSGIESWSDLEGKTIGVIPGSFSNVKFTLAARENGVDLDTIDFVQATPVGATNIQALRDGVMDGVVIWPPIINEAIAAGVAYFAEGLDVHSSSLGSVNQVLTTTDAFLENEELLDRFLELYVATVEGFQEDPDSWATLVAELTGSDEDLAIAAAGDPAVGGVLDMQVDMTALSTAAEVGPEFGYATSDVSDQIEGILELGPLARALGVDPSELVK